MVKAYDPEAMEKTKRELPEVIYCSNPYEAVKDADAMLICTEWDEFKNLNFENIRSLMKRPFIFDGRNICDKDKMISLGFEYQGIGQP